MRIGIIAPPWLPIPPVAYGGTEAVIDNLARGLQGAGHDLSLFTTADSTCPVNRSWTYNHSLGVGVPGVVAEVRHVAAAYECMRALDIDIIHDHTIVGPIYSQWFPRMPVVTTNHGPFDSELLDIYRALGRRVPIIAVSNHHSRSATETPIAATIHHGISTDEFPFGSGAGGFALFLGRLHPSKGAHVAARVARAAGIPLRIAAKMSEQVEIEYFESKVKPLLGSDIEFVGELSFGEKCSALKDAACLLNPIRWPEPFGMVMVESMACGTPVIATRHGAVPEIINHGVTGYVCDSEQELVDAIGNVNRLSRLACRAWVERNFSLDLMVERHVALYERVLAKRSADPLIDIGSDHFAQVVG